MITSENSHPLFPPATDAELSIARIDPELSPEYQRELKARGYTVSMFGAVSVDMSDPRNQGVAA
jgi:hypothetical protein